MPLARRKKDGTWRVVSFAASPQLPQELFRYGKVHPRCPHAKYATAVRFFVFVG
jgi:hypothetical protein